MVTCLAQFKWFFGWWCSKWWQGCQIPDNELAWSAPNQLDWSAWWLVGLSKLVPAWLSWIISCCCQWLVAGGVVSSLQQMVVSGDQGVFDCSQGACLRFIRSTKLLAHLACERYFLWRLNKKQWFHVVVEDDSCVVTSTTRCFLGIPVAGCQLSLIEVHQGNKNGSTDEHLVCKSSWKLICELSKNEWFPFVVEEGWNDSLSLWKKVVVPPLLQQMMVSALGSF